MSRKTSSKEISTPQEQYGSQQEKQTHKASKQINHQKTLQAFKFRSILHSNQYHQQIRNSDQHKKTRNSDQHKKTRNSDQHKKTRNSDQHRQIRYSDQNQKSLKPIRPRPTRQTLYLDQYLKTLKPIRPRPTQGSGISSLSSKVRNILQHFFKIINFKADILVNKSYHIGYIWLGLILSV